MKRVLAIIAALLVILSGCQKDNEKPYHFNVKYYGNGGMTIDGQSMVEKEYLGTRCRLMSNCFTNGSKDFIGWNTEWDGYGENYAPNEELYTSNYSNVHLYAIWRTGIWMQNGSKQIEAGETYEFYDSNGPTGNYSYNEDYTFTFFAPAGMRIKIVFTSFYTESVNYDYMTINGTRYGGTTGPGTVYSTSNSLTIKWHSDGSYNYSGWRAVVSVVQ